jgi:heavy metal translocating P-type ATPase
MEFSIRHWIKGRIRLHVPALGRETAVSERLAAWLSRQNGLHEVRINYSAASLVVSYDEANRPLLELMLAWFAGASLAELKDLIADDASTALSAPMTPPHPHPATPPRPSGGQILALPTLSLGLAFATGPLAVAVNVPLMLWNAIPIAKRAWTIWHRERRLNVDFLDTLAIGASIGQGLMVTGCIITWLIRLGDWIRDLTAAGSKRAIAELMEFQDRSAWLVRNGVVVAVPAAELAEGDIVVVYPGEMVAVDGEVIEGRALIDQKTITGESLPVPRGVGDSVYAATVLREGQIRLRAIRVGVDTTAGQIAQLVDSAPVGDTRMQNHAERFADRLVMPTLGLAAGTAAFTADFQRFLSLVIVDFGTGIRVAAPTSVLASMTHAARSGIIIKSGGHMERLAEVDTVVFDKTGTLTHGVPEVIDVIPYRSGISADHLLGLAVAAETRLQHPVAEALRARARRLGVDVPLCDETDYKLGLGVQGQVNGYYMHVGSERFLRGSQIQVRQAARDRAALDERGYSSLYVAVDGKLAGLIPYADQIRPESRAVIRTLHGMGIANTIMLTGDNASVARAVGSRLGLTRQFSDMMPEDKAAVIETLKGEGKVVAMVGDGINDSVALTYSDVGIAMRHGAQIAHESAHVVLMEDSLWKLVKAIEVSRGAVSLIRQNYGIVAALNIAALGLALPGGLVGPHVTAILSNGSAILASLNGIRPLMRAT